MKPLRIGYSTWSGAFIAVSFTFSTGGLRAAQSAPMVQPAAAKKAAVAKAKPPVKTAAPAAGKATPAPANAAGKILTSGAAPDEFADAYPGNNWAASPDLALADDGRRKADALAAFARALVAEDNAETEQAMAGYKRTLALDPSYTDLAVKIAYEMAKKNDASGGIQVLKDAAKAAPKDPRPLVYLAQLYSKYLKKTDIAQKYAEQAIALDPTQFSGYLALYDLSMAANDRKKAEEVVDRAGKIKSADPKFWLQLGDLTTRLYLKEDGAAEPQNIERMNAIYRRAAELGAGDGTTQAKVGDYFVLSRQVKAAIPYYLAALRKDTASDDPSMANLREKLARAFLITDDKEQAIQMLESVVAEHPMRFETYELLGELYLQKGDMEHALTNFEQTLLLDGSNVDSYLRLAKIYLELKHPDRAVDTMRQARAKFPDVPQVTISLAITLSQAKRHTEAMTAFAEARADAEQNHSELLDATFFLRYGGAAERAGLFDKAAELLKESIRLDPANASEARNYLGYMWVDHDMNLEEGGEYIKKALEQDPDNGAYLDSLGWYYFKKGDHERALKELQRALENIKEEDPEIFRHLGDTYQALGRIPEAMTYWQKSVALEDSAELREKIEAAKQKVTKSGAKPDTTGAEQ